MIGKAASLVLLSGILMVLVACGGLENQPLPDIGDTAMPTATPYSVVVPIDYY